MLKSLFTGLSLVVLLICVGFIIWGCTMMFTEPDGGGWLMVLTGIVVFLALLFKTVKPGRGES